MAAEPPVLGRLKALGLDQKTIAQFLGASPASVSMWCMGKTAFEEPWLTEALVLVAVLSEHLAQGGTLATFRHEPGLDLVSGSPHRVASLRIPLDEAVEFHKFQAELASLPAARRGPAEWAWEAQLIIKQLAAWVGDANPRTWQPPAHELDAMRRQVDFLHGLLTGLLITAPQPGQEGPHADQTP
jgi:transcriptional regulator with XRE-family HTH domain